MIDFIFQQFYKFCQVYVNDIVVFFMLLKKYLKHLKLIFKILDDMNIHLVSHKLFFKYFFIHLLS